MSLPLIINKNEHFEWRLYKSTNSLNLGMSYLGFYPSVMGVSVVAFICLNLKPIL